MITGLLSPRRDWPWFLVGCIIALSWFTLALSLPPLFRGEICCDSTGYVKIATQLPQKTAALSSSPSSTLGKASGFIRQVFTYAGYTPPGYPLFLTSVRTIGGTTGLTRVVAWLPLALGVALLLHLIVALFFWRSLKVIGLPLHPLGLTLLAAHPGLVSHAAIPLADALAVTAMMAALGCLCRASLPRWHGRMYAIMGGGLLAYTVYTRTSHLPAAALSLIGWCLIAIVIRWRERSSERTKASLLLPLLALAAFAIALSPRIIACTRAAGHLCYSLPPSKGEPLAANLIREGLTGARTFTLLGNKTSALVTLSDDFFITFSRSCTIRNAHPLPDLLSCFVRHPLSVIPFLTKKAIGLFDNFFWNSYATDVTPLWIVLYNRLFGVIGFVGFGAFMWMGIAMLADRRRSVLQHAPTIFLYPIIYVCSSVLLMIESRYGLPLAPFGMAGMGIVLAIGKQRMLPRFEILMFCTLGLLFLTQTFLWDAMTPLPRSSIEQAMKRDGPPPIMPPLSTVGSGPL